ncbi:MAG: sigma-70 family RNA polymerase sigma factor [Chloroflexota bacterium]
MHSNEDWLALLRNPEENNALDELRKILLKGLGHALRSRHELAATDLEDFVQDALLKILDNLDTFKGESRFTTWAQKIAVRVALTELRRRRWQDTSLDGMVEKFEGDYMPKMFAAATAGPEDQAIRSSLMRTLKEAIEEKLTDKQREAMVAVRIHGMPLEEVAERMGTNRNSLYKLLHDARQRLQKELMSLGVSSEEILSAF